VGEVDQLEDAVDERVAERDQRVDAARRDPDQEDVEEVGRRPDQVDDQPDGEEPDEDEPQDREDAWTRASPEAPEGRRCLCACLGRDLGAP
jgi:hypothetical protein